MTTKTTYAEEIRELVSRLDTDKQRQVLDYVRGLETPRPRGETGKEFLERTKHIHIDHADLEAIRQAIEEDLEQIEDFPVVNQDTFDADVH